MSVRLSALAWDSPGKWPRHVATGTPQCHSHVIVASSTEGHTFPVLALVSSTGGLNALARVLGPLPAGFPAAVIAMQHADPTHPSELAKLLDRQTALVVRPAISGAALVPGEVLVPPAGSHLLVGRDDLVHLIPTGLLPPARPSADLLLSTLAVALGKRAVAVVLSGSGHDASLGVQAISLFGGACFMQDEASSVQYGMPSAATAAGNYGPPLPLDEIAAVLVTLLGSGSGQP